MVFSFIFTDLLLIHKCDRLYSCENSTYNKHLVKIQKCTPSVRPTDPSSVVNDRSIVDLCLLPCSRSNKSTFVSFRYICQYSQRWYLRLISRYPFHFLPQEICYPHRNNLQQIKNRVRFIPEFALGVFEFTIIFKAHLIGFIAIFAVPDSFAEHCTVISESITHPFPSAYFQSRVIFSGQTSSALFASPPLNFPIAGPTIQRPRLLPGM